MTNNTVTVTVSSKYLQVNEIHDIRERFIIIVVYTIFVGIQLKESGIQIPLTTCQQIAKLTKTLEKDHFAHQNHLRLFVKVFFL